LIGTHREDKDIIKINIEMKCGTNYEKELLYENIIMILDKYCCDLILNDINVIVVPIDYLPNKSSGRMEGMNLLLSYQLFEDISKTNRFYDANSILKLSDIMINEESKEAILILQSTIFHELVHFDRRKLIPEIYNAVEKYWDEDIYLAMAALYWAEYDAHLISDRLENLIVSTDFCKSFIEYDWKTNKNGYLYLLKCLSYFITRMRLLKNNNVYLNIFEIKNKSVKKLIEKTEFESNILENKIPFNDISYLNALKMVFKEIHKEIDF